MILLRAILRPPILRSGFAQVKVVMRAFSDDGGPPESAPRKLQRDSCP
jgi:hypothetical protein